LLDRKVAGLGALKDLVDIESGATILLRILLRKPRTVKQKEALLDVPGNDGAPAAAAASEKTRLT
jgi:hypothetical protein